MKEIKIGMGAPSGSITKQLAKQGFAFADERLDELGRQTKDLAKMAIDMDMDALDVVDWNADIQEILKAYKEQQMAMACLEEEV